MPLNRRRLCLRAGLLGCMPSLLAACDPFNLKEERASSNQFYIEGLRQSTGAVDINGYMAWLRSHDYCFAGDACAN